MDPESSGSSTETPTPQPTKGTRKPVPGFGSIYLRGRIWHIEYWQGNQQFRESSRSEKERVAVQLLKQRHGEMARGEFISPQKDKILLSELLDAVKRDYELARHRSISALSFRMVPLKEAFGHLRAVHVTESLIERYKSDRLDKGKARATVNRELAALRRAFKLAVGQKQLSPNRVPTVRLFTEDNARQGFVDYEDFSELVKHLGSPEDDVAWFAYLSGWRRGEVLSLTWADVDQTRGVVTLRPEYSKNKEKRELPLVTLGLQAVISRRWQARLVMGANGPKVCDSLFHRDGEPVKDIRRAWARAAKAIGRPDLLFHDLRRSAVRNLVNNGTPERVAMRITGHKTREVFDRYMIVDDRDVRAALERTETALTMAPHKSAIFPHSEAETNG